MLCNCHKLLLHKSQSEGKQHGISGISICNRPTKHHSKFIDCHPVMVWKIPSDISLFHSSSVLYTLLWDGISCSKSSFLASQVVLFSSAL